MSRPHVALWHPWLDKSGMSHSLAYWKDNSILDNQGIVHYFQDVDTLVDIIASKKLYVMINDILRPSEFSFADELLSHKKTHPFLSKTGKILALQCRKRTSGFFIPCRGWYKSALPDVELLDKMTRLFGVFNLQAITLASLSEKVLRSTLPEKVFIYRPTTDFRKVLLENNGGARIEESTESFTEDAFEYDLNKAYLHFSRLVPSPFLRPFFHIRPSLNEIFDYATGFWEVSMVAHGGGKHPISLKNPKHVPQEGEQFRTWLWNNTIMACLEKGYTLECIHRGYGIPELSDFMAPWADILWEKYQSADDDLLDMIKGMMVGLPGRFLKTPDTYTLIHKKYVQDGDKPIMLNWIRGDEKMLSDWYVRREFNRESTSLTPIGASIINDCRLALYQQEVAEEEKGNVVYRAYVDCYVVGHPTVTPQILGNDPGLWKEKTYKNAYFEANRMVAEGYGIEEAIIKAPGLTTPQRIKLLQKYRRMILS